MPEITLRRSSNGSTKIYFAQNHIGTVEDVGDYDYISSILRRLIKEIKKYPDNSITIVEQFSEDKE